MHTLKSRPTQFTKVGEIGVDTASLILADPYHLRLGQCKDTEGELMRAVEDELDVAVEVSLGSDGIYDVFVRYDEFGCLAELRIPVDDIARQQLRDEMNKGI